MRLCITLLLALSLFTVAAAHAASTHALALKGDTVIVVATGKKVDADVKKAENAPLRYACIDEATAEANKVAKGVYMFDAQGKQVLRVLGGKDDEPETVFGLSFAPSGKLMAVDAGEGEVRDLHFMTFPEGKPVGKPLTFFSGSIEPVWRNQDSVIAMVVGPEAKARENCPFQFCESPISVASYTPASGAQTLLFAFDPLCNIFLSSYKDNMLTASKECYTAVQWQGPTLPEPAKQALTYTFTSK